MLQMNTHGASRSDDARLYRTYLYLNVRNIQSWLFIATYPKATERFINQICPISSCGSHKGKRKKGKIMMYATTNDLQCGIAGGE